MTKAQLSPHLSRPCQLSTREGEKDTHTHHELADWEEEVYQGKKQRTAGIWSLLVFEKSNSREPTIMCANGCNAMHRCGGHRVAADPRSVQSEYNYFSFSTTTFSSPAALLLPCKSLKLQRREASTSFWTLATLAYDSSLWCCPRTFWQLFWQSSWHCTSFSRWKRRLGCPTPSLHFYVTYILFYYIFWCILQLSAELWQDRRNQATDKSIIQTFWK